MQEKGTPTFADMASFAVDPITGSLTLLPAKLVVESREKILPICLSDIKGGARRGVVQTCTQPVYNIIMPKSAICDVS